MSHENALSKANPSPEDETEAALIDAELFLKYQVPHRAVERLKATIERRPHAVKLRERLREIAAGNNQPDEAARQCLALANLYIAREDFDTAQDRLLEAKQHDARISIASGLEAIRRARHPAPNARASSDFSFVNSSDGAQRSLLSGDLSFVSVFDLVQVLENGKRTGALVLQVKGGSETYRIHFNEGRIVGAADESGKSGNDKNDKDKTANDESDRDALAAFQRTIEITDGAFDFELSPTPFPVTINAASNTNLMLDTLRLSDEEKNR